MSSTFIRVVVSHIVPTIDFCSENVWRYAVFLHRTCLHGSDRSKTAGPTDPGRNSFLLTQWPSPAAPRCMDAFFISKRWAFISCSNWLYSTGTLMLSDEASLALQVPINPEHCAEHGSTHPFWAWAPRSDLSAYNDGCILLIVMLLYWWHRLDNKEFECIRNNVFADYNKCYHIKTFLNVQYKIKISHISALFLSFEAVPPFFSSRFSSKSNYKSKEKYQFYVNYIGCHKSKANLSASSVYSSYFTTTQMMRLLHHNRHNFFSSEPVWAYPFPRHKTIEKIEISSSSSGLWVVSWDSRFLPSPKTCTLHWSETLNHS